MECEVVWDGFDAAQWDRVFAQVPRSTLLQARGYADAVCPGLGQHARRGLVRIGADLAGLVQVQEASAIGGALHAVILDRGPLWLPGFGTAAHVAAFFRRFSQEFPTRPGRRRRILPEAPGPIDAPGLRPVTNRPPYQTMWVDLTPDPDVLRRRLRPKWRNMLSRAEREGVTVRWDWTGRSLGAMLSQYAADQQAKSYSGPAPETVAAIARRLAPAGAVGIGVAVHGDAAVAGMLVFLHGRAATYQVGWVDPAGRAVGANNLLLWSAMAELKSRGIRDFDLGGVNDADAAGVKRFKEGIGGRLVTLAGQFR
ncbi:MAG: GNAT family N-acetyltransferase [Pseudomonadota bacterium]